MSSNASFKFISWEKQHKRNYPVSIYEIFVREKVLCGLGFFFERMLNEIMNSLGQTFVCWRCLPSWIFITREEVLFSPKPSKLPISIRATTIWLPCSLLYLCTSHPMPHVQMCFFQVGEAKDLRSKIITTQPPSCILKRKVWFSILRRILNPSQSRKI